AGPRRHRAAVDPAAGPGAAGRPADPPGAAGRPADRPDEAPPLEDAAAAGRCRRRGADPRRRGTGGAPPPAPHPGRGPAGARPGTGGGSGRDQIRAVMEAPDARWLVAPLSGGGSMPVASSPGLRDGVVLGERLPRLDRAHDYQLWMVDRAGSARSAHVLIAGTGAPSTGPNLVHGLRPGDRIAITEEPAGGSRQPTSPPLAVTRGT